MIRASWAGTFAVLLLAAPAGAQVARYQDVVIAPDGHHVAWVGPRPGGSRDGLPVIVLTDRRASAAAPAVIAVPGADSGSAHDLTWSTDGTALAFVATTEDGAVPVLYVASVTGGPARRVARIPGAVSAPRFSPDGARLAVLYTSPTESANGPLDAAPRDTGVIDDHVDRQHLVVVDVASGRTRHLTPADLYVYEFDWSPDGRALVASAATGSGNNNWWVARLYAIPADSGHLRELAAPTTQIAQPRWSPDGSRIAYIGGLMSDQGVTGGDVYVVPADGGTPRNLTPDAHVSVSTIAWVGAQTILAGAWSNGGSAFGRIDAEHGGFSDTWHGDEWVTTGVTSVGPALSATRDGAVTAVVRETITTAPDVWVGPIGHWVAATHASAAPQSWGKSASVTWRSDGFDVQGWLIYPHDFDPSRRYPMIVDVHGGPAYAWPPNYGSPYSVESALSAAGYFVFLPNPRGSYGEGERFTRANVKDFGYGDLRDILAGVDQVVARFPVDSLRLGITGWSYGGFMTMWAVTQTRRFRAAVSGAGLSDWLSYTG
ncbi:MAG TPA: prolyl oligopeptidase family serine peptidase, partial [Gemmatimonadaceae bacterium]|nr:prolyl oligopeptidase family serine peptidase [Gemmatimonadaceae bacterium]